MLSVGQYLEEYWVVGPLMNALREGWTHNCSGASRVSPLKWRGTFGGIMEVKWSFWTQIGGSKSAIYISILPYIAPVMKQIHLFANKFDQSNIYDYELVFILTGSSLLIIAEW